MATWMEIYRSYGAEELRVEIETLKLELKNSRGMASQSSGSKSYQRDLADLRNRLAAATRVSEKAAGRIPRYGVVDASSID